MIILLFLSIKSKSVIKCTRFNVYKNKKADHNVFGNKCLIFNAYLQTHIGTLCCIIQNINVKTRSSICYIFFMCLFYTQFICHAYLN